MGDTTFANGGSVPRTWTAASTAGVAAPWMTWPESGLQVEMSSPDADRFQVYSPASGGVFVAEPVQNAHAALNLPQAQWADAGLRLLARGQASVLNVRFEVQEVDRQGS